MREFKRVLILLAASALLFAVACDDDDTTDHTVPTDPTDPTDPEGGYCENAADLAIIDDLGGVINNLARDCMLDVGLFDPADVTDCIVNGNEAHELEGTGLSDDCAFCYAETALCGFNECLGPCAADAASEACLACLGENCLPPFCECAGDSIGNCAQ